MDPVRGWSGAFFAVAPNLIFVDKTSRKSRNARLGAFSGATSHAKLAASTHISIILGRIVNGEGLDGGEGGFEPSVPVTQYARLATPLRSSPDGSLTRLLGTQTGMKKIAVPHLIH